MRPKCNHCLPHTKVTNHALADPVAGDGFVNEVFGERAFEDGIHEDVGWPQEKVVDEASDEEEVEDDQFLVFARFAQLFQRTLHRQMH